MKPAKSLKRNLEKIRLLSDSRKYSQAFRLAERLLEEWPDNPHVLVMWANLLQLQEEKEGPALDKARAALERAVELDECAPMPLNQLGHYLFALEDDTRAADQCFSKAITLCKRYLREALVARAEALSELGHRQEALALLAEAYWLESRNGTSRQGSDGEEILEHLKSLGQANGPPRALS